MSNKQNDIIAEDGEDIKKILNESEEKMDSFLPVGYKLPATNSNYMKFQQGENVFRILSNPITGWEWWETVIVDGKEARRPCRVVLQDGVPITAMDDEKNPPKHFWAMAVYNYQEKRIQILELTQKGIHRAILALSNSKGWGDPKGYDISVTKTGEKKETEYSVMPVPPKPVNEGILQKYKETYIDLEALYRGEDPFEKK